MYLFVFWSSLFCSGIVFYLLYDIIVLLWVPFWKLRGPVQVRDVVRTRVVTMERVAAVSGLLCRWSSAEQLAVG